MELKYLSKIIGAFIDEVLRLSKQYPNDQEFGRAIRGLIKLYRQEGDRDTEM